MFDITEKIDVPPLKADNLTLVLREPARVLGVGFESDDLVNHIVKSAEDQPGALPLLADLFTDLWERMRERGDGRLRVSDRREIIQVDAALTKRADQFLAQHPDKHEAVKRLFTLRSRARAAPGRAGPRALGAGCRAEQSYRRRCRMGAG